MSADEFTAWSRGEIRSIHSEYRRVLAEGAGRELAKEVAEIAPHDPDQGNLFVLPGAGVGKGGKQ